jgi:hypothetical protein
VRFTHPLWPQESLSNLSSLAIRRARRYLGPLNYQVLAIIVEIGFPQGNIQLFQFRKNTLNRVSKYEQDINLILWPKKLFTSLKNHTHEKGPCWFPACPKFLHESENPCQRVTSRWDVRTVRNDRLALSIQARHHLLLQLQLIPHRMRQEIRVDEDAVRCLQGRIILEK